MFKATAYFYGFVNPDDIVYIIILRALFMNPSSHRENNEAI